jgi:monofunctional glycosyltransferase
MKNRKVSRALHVAAGVGAVTFSVMAYGYLTLPDVRPLATTNPKTTAFMELREREAAAAGKPVKHVQRWVPYSRMSMNLRRAVLAAEDSAFFEHEGIDIAEIKKSIQTSIEKGESLRGASTITQQLAKNLYLSPSRDPMRKLKELMITWRLETALSKARILEIYLNVIEWGNGVFGAEAAARKYFGVSAAQLSPEQAARLAAMAPNPRFYENRQGAPGLNKKIGIIMARMPSAELP